MADAVAMKIGPVAAYTIMRAGSYPFCYPPLVSLAQPSEHGAGLRA